MRYLAAKAAASLVMAASALGFAHSAWAESSHTASGAFFFTSAPTTTVLHRSSGNTLVRLDFPSAAINGGITGTFSETLFIRTHPNGEEDVSGLATCACSVGGRSGILFFDFVGRGTIGGLSEAHFVLSGEGDLEGLHGTGIAVVSPAFVGRYSAEYHFTA